jgi:hypothetical protein
MTDSDKGSLLLFGFIVLLVVVAVLVFGTDDLINPNDHPKVTPAHGTQAAAKATAAPKIVPKSPSGWAWGMNSPPRPSNSEQGTRHPAQSTASQGLGTPTQ